MRRFGRAGFSVVAAAAALGLLSLLAHRPAGVVASGARAAHPHRARGAVHVHTGFSGDGRGSVDEVARAARAAGLDFVVVTDHNTEASLAVSGYRRGVLVVGGLEKSTDGGHALVLGVSKLPFRLDGDPANVTRDVADLGGFVVAAHPTSSHGESAWTGEMRGVAAIEFLNLAEPGAWPTGLGLLPPVAQYFADPQGALLRSLSYSRAPLAMWDRVLVDRPLAGTLGSDAHGGFRLGRLWLPFPSHEQIFRLASQHLLLDGPFTRDGAQDEALVLRALRAGRGYGALDALADASGFLLEARCGGRRALPGESLPLAGQAEIRADADAPAGTTLVLLKNGEEVARGPRIRHRTGEAGVYRVEGYLDPALAPGSGRLPWILSNPVYVFDAEEIEARAARARLLPEETPWPRSVQVLEDFEGPSLSPRWQIDRAPDSAAQASLDGGALRLDYSLGPGQKTHASICDWGPLDLSEARSLVFRVRADRPTRFDVQVRVTDLVPAGTRIWRGSVRAQTDWKRVAVPLAGLKTYDRRGGRPDLGQVQGIYFHMDEAMLAPGSRGTLWIDDLGLGR